MSMLYYTILYYTMPCLIRPYGIFTKTDHTIPMVFILGPSRLRAQVVRSKRRTTEPFCRMSPRPCWCRPSRSDGAFKSLSVVCGEFGTLGIKHKLHERPHVYDIIITCMRHIYIYIHMCAGLWMTEYLSMYAPRPSGICRNLDTAGFPAMASDGAMHPHHSGL